MSLVEYGNQLTENRTVYYSGTAALVEGQPLFYVPPSGAPTIGDSDKTNRVGVVVDSDDGNGLVGAFAGIVADNSVGRGEGYVDVLVPRRGDFVRVQVTNFAAITAEVTYVTPDTAGVSDAAGLVGDATPAATDGCIFLAMETVAVNGGVPGTGDASSVILAKCIR